MSALNSTLTICFVCYSAVHLTHSASAQTSWKPIKIGAGGYITGYDASNDGVTRVIKTDTYGDYKWNATNSRWEQMLTYQSMGPTVAIPSSGKYVYEVVVAPSDSRRIYRWYSGKVYKSINAGETWSATSYIASLDAFEFSNLARESRLWSKMMAVDPADPETLLSGSYIDGMRLSNNGGHDWISLTAQVPPATLNGYKVKGHHKLGDVNISVDTGTIGIPPNSTIWFEGSTKQYNVSLGLSSGSGTITVSPALAGDVAGSTWVKSAGGIRIAYDPASRVVNGRTQGIYAASYGNGVYRSADGGRSWSHIGGLIDVSILRVGIDGTLYVANRIGNVVQRYDGSWTDISPGNQIAAIATDPNNANRIVLNGGGFLITSLNKGKSWSSTAGAYWAPNCLKSQNVPFAGQRREAKDIPWLAWANECIMSAADIRFDPVLPGSTSRLWFAQGIGVWYFDFGSITSAPSSQITWISQSAGIEQLVTNQILSAPGSKAINFIGWDRPQFYVTDPNAYQSRYGPSFRQPCGILHGWSMDYASSAPSTVVGIFNYFPGVSCSKSDSEQSGKSLDGGSTWTEFSAKPSNNPDNGGNGYGGSIAASTPNNILWCPQNNNAPSYTLDGGTSWTKLTSSQIPNLPADGNGDQGFGFQMFLYSRVCAADRVNANQFYFYNYGSRTRGFWRSNDGGVSWTRIFSSLLVPGSTAANAKLITVPGRAGHMFFTFGPQGVPPIAFGGFWRSTNASTAAADAQTWAAVHNVGGVIAFGLGASAPGGDYPTVFIAGWVGGVFGIWQGVGTAAQWDAGRGTGTEVKWTNLSANEPGNLPLGSFDTIKSVEGDANTYGKVYVGYSGSGALFYQP